MQLNDKVQHVYLVGAKSLGAYIEYYFEKEPLGNAGALFKIKDKLTSDFLLLNADAMFDVDFNRFVAFHRKHDGLVTLFTHPNSHPYDSGLIIANKDGSVKKWLAKEDERPQYYRNRVNAGLHVINVEESGWIRVPNMHEAIIPQKLFDTVQEVLKLDTCAYLAEHKELDLLKKYSDRKNDEKARTAFDQMTDDGVERKFDCIIVASMYYCGPDFPAARQAIKETLYATGIDLIVLDEGLDTRTASRKEVEDYFEAKRCEMHAEIMFAWRRKQGAGFRLTSSVPFGYIRRNGESNMIQFIQALLEANGLAAGKDHQFKGRYDAEKNAVIISLKNGE